jgi:hypothetical protein
MTTYRGKIEAGKVVWEGGLQPPDGARVVVTTESGDSPKVEGASRSALPQIDPIYLIGDDAVDGLPEDMSIEHDHYIYGTPKRSERKGP